MRFHGLFKKLKRLSIYTKKSAEFFLLLFREKNKLQTNHRFNLIFSTALLGCTLILFFKLGLFSPDPPAISPDEIDLSGNWKIKYSDDRIYADAKLDDSRWCEIGVPDPKLRMGTLLNPDCPEEIYPTSKMRNSTYWYRKVVFISAGQSWKEPSLFLGTIKHKAWIYWDGQLVAIKDYKEGTGISSVGLEQDQLRPGTHQLSIRVKSVDSLYPGIFHNLPRKVTLGNLEGNISQHRRIIREKFITPSLTLFVQTAGLLLTIILLSLGKGIGAEFFWLATYFFSTSLSASAVALASPEYSSMLLRIAITLSSFSVFGYSLKFHSWIGGQQQLWGKILGLTMFSVTSSYIYLALHGRILGTFATNMSLAIAIFPLTTFIFSLTHDLFGKLIKNRAWKLSGLGAFSLLCVAALHIMDVLKEFFVTSSPAVVSSPMYKAVLTLALLATMIYQFIQQERVLAFFGRFIRPGLRSLLEEKIEKKDFTDIKIFRARKIAIMKVDIVGHTETTYQMPYGVKRLFQDTWFTMIDHVVASRVFMDKNVGDGSIYCFSENHKDGACKSALIAALQIRDEAIKHFDETFKARLKQVLSVTPELTTPVDLFFNTFKARSGIDFWQRKTKIRIGLVYGFVDEGLWGLSSQSHYDVQGDLVSLAARVESKAKENEILMDLAFAKETDGYLNIKTVPRIETLKGVGEVQLFGIESIKSYLEAS